MTRIALLPLLTVLALLPAVGCTYTDQGVVGGAGVGALVGNALAPRGAKAAGTVIGGGVGALVGGGIGSNMDRQDRMERRVVAAEARAAATAMTVPDVISLSASQTSDNVIISQIRTSGSAFHLTANDIITLKNAGVSEAVIREMQDTATRVRPAVYGPPPVEVVRPVYVAPPPPPYYYYRPRPYWGAAVIVR